MGIILIAILFTDVVNFEAIVQDDEKKAMANIEHHDDGPEALVFVALRLPSP